MEKRLKEGTVYITGKNAVTFHSYVSSLQGHMVCSHIIETQNCLVVVDALLLKPCYTELRAYVDGLSKPIDRVIVSHFHPDHWFGLEAFSDVPVHSQQYCHDGIEQAGDTFIKNKRTIYGDLVASEKVIPSNIISDKSVTIDGLTYVFHDVKDTETNIMLLIELPEVKTVIAQDLIYNKVYLFVGEKTPDDNFCCDNWIAALEPLLEKNYELVLPGHGTPGGPEIIAENITYLKEVKGYLESAKDEHDLKKRTVERFPDYQVPEMLDLTNLFLYHKTW